MLHRCELSASCTRGHDAAPVRPALGLQREQAATATGKRLTCIKPGKPGSRSLRHAPEVLATVEFGDPIQTGNMVARLPHMLGAVLSFVFPNGLLFFEDDLHH